MEFRKMVTITLYTKQKKRHRCIEQTFGLCGRRWGWDVSREQHWNMYIIYGETDHQPRSYAWDKCSDKCSGLVHWEDPEGSGWGIHVYPRLIHVNVRQKWLQYCKVISLQLIKKKKNSTFRKILSQQLGPSWKIDGGKNGDSEKLYFLGLQNHCRWWLQPWN